MKSTFLLLGGSLVANAILAGILLTRPAPDRARSPAGAAAAQAGTEGGAAQSRVSALLAALASGDAAALAAAGVPPETIKFIAIGRAFDALQSQGRMERSQNDPVKYWRPAQRNDDPVAARERRLAETQAELEFRNALQRAYGQDIGEIFDKRESRYAILSPEKRERLLRIEQDYTELEAQINAYMDRGIQLPADREKLALLRREKERDLAAALTPEEREQLDLRNSGAANLIRHRFGSVIESEEEYKKFYALQKAFEDRFNLDQPSIAVGSAAARELMQARQEASRKLNEEFRALLTPEQIATLRQKADQDRDLVAGLAQRLSLPASATDTVLAVRERYSAQSRQIHGDAALSVEQRRSQLQNLAVAGQAELEATLGKDGAAAFGQHARWMMMLRNGNAFSTDPKDAPPNHPDPFSTTIFVVPTPGAPGRGGRGAAAGN
jgi:hypothetical protein